MELQLTHDGDTNWEHGVEKCYSVEKTRDVEAHRRNPLRLNAEGGVDEERVLEMNESIYLANCALPTRPSPG